MDSVLFCLDHRTVYNADDMGWRAFGAWLVWALFNLRSTMKQMGRQVELKAR